MNRPCTTNPDLFTTDLILEAGHLANAAAAAGVTEPPSDDLFAATDADDVAAAEEEARQVCLGCPLLLACMRATLGTATDAVQGATTAAERIAIRNRLNIAHPVEPITALFPMEESDKAEPAPPADRHARHVVAIEMFVAGSSTSHEDVIARTGLSQRTVARIASTIRDLRAGESVEHVKSRYQLTDKAIATATALLNPAAALAPRDLTDVDDDELARAAAAVLSPDVHQPVPMLPRAASGHQRALAVA